MFVKIESVVLREIRMPLLQPFETSFGRTSERRILLVEVQSEGSYRLGRVHCRRASQFQRRMYRHRLADADE